MTQADHANTARDNLLAWFEEQETTLAVVVRQRDHALACISIYDAGQNDTAGVSAEETVEAIRAALATDDAPLFVKGAEADHANTAALVATVREGAHFYMAHRMREFPHPADSDITVAEHVKDGCPGCAAEAALDALQTKAETAEAETRSMVDEARRATEAMETAEAERDLLRNEVAMRHRLMREARSERDHARDALRQIAHPLLAKPETYRDIARAALGDKP